MAEIDSTHRKARTSHVELRGLAPNQHYRIALNVEAVRQYHVPSTSAGDASVRSPSSFTCNSLNVRPASTTNVCPSSLVKYNFPFTCTGDAENPSRIATPSRS